MFLKITTHRDIGFGLLNELEPKELRLAEIKFKTGFCNYMVKNYDASIADFQQSADYIQQAIEAKKKLIDDLTKIRENIINKIAEVQKAKKMVRKFCGGFFELKFFIDFSFSLSCLKI